MKTRDLQIITIALMLSFFYVSFTSFESWKQHEKYEITDFANHDKYVANQQNAINDGYPSIIYYFYPFYPTSYFFHLTFILPICLFIYGHVLNKLGYEAIIGYFISFQWYFLTGLGVLKEVFTIEIILLSLALVFYFLHKKNLAGLFASGLIVAFLVFVQQMLQPVQRVMNSFNKGYNEFYLTSLWGTVFFFTSLQQANKLDNKPIKLILSFLLIVLFFVGAPFETRLLNLLFLIELPLIANLFLNEKIL